MADICCGVVSEGEASAGCDRTSREARRRRMEIRRFRFVGDGVEADQKRQKMDASSSSTSSSTSFPWICENTMDSCVSDGRKEKSVAEAKEVAICVSASTSGIKFEIPRFGVASVCGRRRDMEDAVAVHPSFDSTGLHYFAVYDGHGCSHVAMRCRDRLHELVREELVSEADPTEEPNPPPGEAETVWKDTLGRSFNRMDKEAVGWKEGDVGNCRCELQTPECDAVGSTAVIAIVTPEKIVVANCGDSRAVLCRNGKAVPLSTDHKPDRPDELNRIQEAGGRVIYWDGPRVLGVLAMSRAIGDNYLKPYVSSEPEVTITERVGDDECLILASDGLWDVVSNDTACGVARMCLRGKVPPVAKLSTEIDVPGSAEDASDKACSDASMLLTKLALARHSTDNVSVVVIDLRKDT